MNTLTPAQVAVISSEAAMNIILTESKEALSTKYGVRVSLIDQALASNNTEVTKAFGVLVAAGIKTATELVA